MSYFQVLLFSFLFNLSLGCQDNPVGIADSSIVPDSSFTATSYYDSRYAAKNGRLNGVKGWGPKTSTKPNDYLQIDLLEVFAICAVATQGLSDGHEWTTKYNISTSFDNNTWTTYGDAASSKVFTGNTDHNTVVKNALYPPVLAKFIRFIPTAYFGWKVLRVEVYGLKKELPCRSLPVGIGNSKTPDSSMTSSSTYNSTTSPSKARLGYTAGSSWCAATSDSSPYVEINLGSPYIICGIATQGDHMTDQWIQSYQMAVSTDGSTFNKYMENSLAKTFSGGFDSNTIVQNLLDDGASGQYIRIAPISHYGTTNCMRTELYGIQITGGCSSLSVGLSSPSVIPDHRFTASSYYNTNYKPSNGRLITSNKAWAPKTKISSDWLQIDLGSLVYVCGVATQGGGKLTSERATRYKIRWSLDNVNWNYYQENNIDKIFIGNTERYAVVANALTNPVKSKFIRFYPTAYHSWPTMRAGVYGIPSACSSPLGVEASGFIKNSQMTSSSYHNITYTASSARLYGRNSWCSSTSSNTEYIQINTGQVMTVTGIATQGDQNMDKWVKTYIISYSMDGNLWNTYKAGLRTNKVLQGNSDRSSIVVRWLSHPLTARHVKVTPQTWNTAICMRMELYGCDYPSRPVISGLTNQNLAAVPNSYVDLVCIVQEPLIQNFKWYTGNNSDMTDQSTGLVRGVNGLKSTLRVNYTSADDILNTYQCYRSAIVLCSKPFVCRAMYGKAKIDSDAVKSAGVKVRLDYPSTISTPRVDNIQSTSVEVRWTLSALKPSQTRVTSYVLQYHNNTISVPPPAIRHIITGLVIYTNYSVKIKAVSRVGHGQWSQANNFRTDSALPTAEPQLVKVRTLSSQSLRVTWQSPATGVNGLLLGYRISFASVPGIDKEIVAGSEQTSHTFEKLKKWTLYRIKVKVFNDKGDGPPSTIVERTLEDAPSKPPEGFTVIVHSSTSVHLSWRLPPSDSQNGMIRGFKVYYQQSSSGRPLIKRYPGNNTLQGVMNGLEKYTSYDFKVLAYTILDGPYTRIIPVTTEQDAPSSPLNLRTSVIAPNATMAPQVRLTWNVPAFPNGIIMSYIVSYSHNKNPSNLSKHKVQGSVLTATIPVVSGYIYGFRVKAVTIKEGNDTSSQDIIIPIFAPSISPMLVRVNKQDSSHFVVSWQPIPHDKANGPITKYEVMWTLVMQGGKPVKRINTVKEINSTGSSATMDNLITCAWYNTSVRGYTIVGPGPYSKPITVYTSAPASPQNVIVTYRNKNEISLKWSNTEPSTADIEQHTIYFLGTKRYNNTFFHRGKRLSSNPLVKFTVNHLYPDTHYEFQVTASSMCGEGDKSLKTSTNTYIGAPPAPLVRPPLGYFNASITNVTIWPASDINGQIRAYQVIVQRLDKTAIEASKLTDYSSAKEKGLYYYITAEIYPSSKPLPHVFTLGNGKFYGKYENTELERGKEYEVLQRAVTQDRNKHFLKGPMAVIARGTTPPAKITKDKFNSSKTDESIVFLVGCSIVGILFLITVVLLFYTWRIKKKNKSLKAEKRLSERPRHGNTIVENTFSMEERKYTSEEVGSSHTSPPIITEDVYEQIDQRCGSYDRQNIPDQTCTIENTHTAEVNDVHDFQDTPPPLPPPPINDEDYEDIDDVNVTKTHMKKHLEDSLDSAQIRTDFIKPDYEDYEDYEDMDGPATGSPRDHMQPNKTNEKKSDTEGRGNVERDSYEPLQTAQTEYKEPHSYVNIERVDQSQPDYYSYA